MADEIFNDPRLARIYLGHGRTDPDCHLFRHPTADHFPTLRDPSATHHLITSLYLRVTP